MILHISPNHWRALVRSRPEPAQRPAAAAPRAYRGRRETLSQSPTHGPRAGGQALAIAPRRDLRAAAPRPGPPRRSRDLLAPVCGWFIEGFDTPDPARSVASASLGSTAAALVILPASD